MAFLDQAWVAWTLLGGGGLLLLWALFWDRARGRKRCRRCQYDMRAALANAKGVFLCPECGTRHAHAKQLLRTHRRWRWAAIGRLLMLGAYAYNVSSGVRDRGWVAAVPTWVLVLGPMEVRVSDKVPVEFEVSSDWPDRMAAEFGDWLEWTPSTRYPVLGPGFSPRILRKEPWWLWRRVWTWRIERHLEAQGSLWTMGSPAGDHVVFVRYPTHALERMFGEPGEQQTKPGRSMGNWPAPLHEGSWGVWERRAVEEIVQRRHRDNPRSNPFLSTRSSPDDLWIFGHGESMTLLHELVSSVRRVRRAADHARWASDVATADGGELVVVRAMPDVVEALTRQKSARWASLQVHERYGIRTPAVKTEDERFVSLFVVVEDGAITIAVQTPDQRDAMDADLAAWRKELGLAP